MLNCDLARDALKKLEFCTTTQGYTGKAYNELCVFIDDVEKLLKENSIKQTPALFKPINKG